MGKIEMKTLCCYAVTVALLITPGCDAAEKLPIGEWVEIDSMLTNAALFLKTLKHLKTVQVGKLKFEKPDVAKFCIFEVNMEKDKDIPEKKLYCKIGKYAELSKQRFSISMKETNFDGYGRLLSDTFTIEYDEDRDKYFFKLDMKVDLISKVLGKEIHSVTFYGPN